MTKPRDRTAQARHVLARMAFALAVGAMTVLTFSPFSILALVPVAYSALFVILRSVTVGQALVIGWAFGLGQFGFGISWISESFYVEADRFGALAIPAVLGLSAGLAFFPAIAAALFSGVLRHKAMGHILAGLLLATFWTLAEWLRGHVLTGFPWNLAGYALVDRAALRQPAAWVGSYGLSFLTLFIGTLPGAALMAAGRQKWSVTLTAFVCLASVWGAGTLRLQTQAPAPPGVDLRIVQGNVPQGEKWTPRNREATFAKYLDMSSRPGNVDVLLWPETAFPGFLDEDDAARARIADALPEGRVLLTGVPDRAPTEDDMLYFNTVQALDDTAQILTGYAKHHLVPFGEYVPLRGWIPIERLTQGMGDFTPGPGPRTLALPVAPLVAAAICYEIIFPGHVVDDLFRPDWIFNATNDAWFGTSIGPEQHLASARMRAVEEGLPIVRAANTGISAIIDATGEVLARLDTGETGFLDAGLPAARPPTPYGRFGDWTLLALIASSWAIALISAKAIRRLDPQRSTPHA
nr:apolipoprotein N-acyltransferase [Roseovarius nanhaiticus]